MIKWTDARKQQPEKGDYYLVTVKVKLNGTICYYVSVSSYNPMCGWNVECIWAKVIAWAICPKPYIPAEVTA